MASSFKRSLLPATAATFHAAMLVCGAPLSLGTAAAVSGKASPTASQLGARLPTAASQSQREIRAHSDSAAECRPGPAARRSQIEIARHPRDGGRRRTRDCGVRSLSHRGALPRRGRPSHCLQVDHRIRVRCHWACAILYQDVWAGGSDASAKRLGSRAAQHGRSLRKSMPGDEPRSPRAGVRWRFGTPCWSRAERGPIVELHIAKVPECHGFERPTPGLLAVSGAAQSQLIEGAYDFGSGLKLQNATSRPGKSAAWKFRGTPVVFSRCARRTHRRRRGWDRPNTYQRCGAEDRTLNSGTGPGRGTRSRAEKPGDELVGIEQVCEGWLKMLMVIDHPGRELS